MARISTYALDSDVSSTDKVIGTDSAGIITKNFKLSDVTDWMNNTGQVTIVGQNNFKFQTTGGRQGGTVSFPNMAGANTPFSAITALVFSNDSVTGDVASTFMTTLIGKQIVLARLDNPNNFGIYTLEQFSARDQTGDFYDAVFTLVSANGEIISNKNYGFAGYTSSEGGGGGGGDKNFVFTQSVASATWVITHNLGKYPSASVTDSALNTVYGDVFYNDTNTLTITFNASFGGKAFLN